MVVVRVAPVIELTAAEKKKLEQYRRARSAPVRLKERAAMILLAAQGLENSAIAGRLDQDVGKVGRWRKRYAQSGLEGIAKDKTRPGRIRALSAAQRSRIIKLTLHSKPKKATHWSRGSMAKEVGVSPSTVGRVWAANGLKPHRLKTFKLSNDKRFEEKLAKIVGLYLSPPEHAIVLSCDEKSQMQALDRTQPGLPLKKGRSGTMTHDYQRNGTTCLFAALNILNGSVIGTCQQKHRHQEWIKFLNLIKRSVPKGKAVHLICDNYATHKHPKVKAWFARNQRFHCHFTPTSASWLNMVERFFRDLSEHQLRRGVFKSVAQLEAVVRNYLKEHNQAPKPFIWTATATDILSNVKRARNKLNKTQSV
jgi:transposase